MLWHKNSDRETSTDESTSRDGRKLLGQSAESLVASRPAWSQPSDRARLSAEIRNTLDERRLSKYLPKLVEAVARKKALKDNCLYSFEIEERREDSTTGAVKVDRTNHWVYIQRDCFYVVDDSDAKLPQIGGDAASVLHRSKSRQFEAKLKLASRRRQQKAWREFSHRRKIHRPLKVHITVDSASLRDRHSAQDSVRKLLQSTLRSPVPYRYEAARQKQDEDEMIHPTVLVSYQPKGERSFESLLSGSLAFRKRSERLKSTKLTARSHANDNRSHVPTIGDDARAASFDPITKNRLEPPQTILGRSKTMVPVQRQGTGQKPNSEMPLDPRPCWDDLRSSPLAAIRNKKYRSVDPRIPPRLSDFLYSGRNVHHPNHPDVVLGSVSTTVSPQTRRLRHNLNRLNLSPTWPSLVDVQKLKSGGFRYRQPEAKSNSHDTEFHRHVKQNMSSTPAASPLPEIVKPKPENRGTIVVPSHTTEDCPLCNLYETQHHQHPEPEPTWKNVQEAIAEVVPDSTGRAQHSPRKKRKSRSGVGASRKGSRLVGLQGRSNTSLALPSGSALTPGKGIKTQFLKSVANTEIDHRRQELTINSLQNPL